MPNKPLFEDAKIGQRPSAGEHNRITGMLAAIASSLHIQGYIDSSGFHTRRSPVHIPAHGHHTIFKVHDDTCTGDGLYNCYEQELDATEWPDVVGTNKFVNKDAEPVDVVVLNLAEFDCLSHDAASYVEHLLANDLLMAWQVTDDEGTIRWVGVPFLLGAQGAGNRRAFCKNDAGATTEMTCYLDVDATGTEVTVYFDVAQGGTGAVNLNVVSPLLKDGDPITVYKTSDEQFRCTTVMMPYEVCDCVEP